MLNAQQAVKRAAEILSEIMPDAQDVRLEEIELPEYGNSWEVTLSYPVTPDNPFEALGGRTVRTYKLVRFDKDTGEFRAIKNRSV